MKKVLNSYFMMIVLIFVFMNYAGLSTLESSIGDDNSSGKVIIISNKSGFTDPVISQVVNILQKEGCYVLLNDIKELNNSIAKKYDAIVIINKTKTNQKDNQVKIFLDEQQQKKIVLLNAVGNEYWKSNKIDNTDKIVNKIIEKVHIIFETGK
ncbi:MAG: hypothetical protein PHE88_03645 [Elusimicrobia bacterium]|nr:hypothetical protein [Elusimicrobiota bacterium]